MSSDVSFNTWCSIGFDPDNRLHTNKKTTETENSKRTTDNV